MAGYSAVAHVKSAIHMYIYNLMIPLAPESLLRLKIKFSQKLKILRAELNMMSSPESNSGHIGEKRMLPPMRRQTLKVIFLTYQTYAQRARTIVNRAVINEDPNARIIRGELKKTSRKIIFSFLFF